MLRADQESLIFFFPITQSFLVYFQLILSIDNCCLIVFQCFNVSTAIVVDVSDVIRTYSNCPVVIELLEMSYLIG